MFRPVRQVTQSQYVAAPTKGMVASNLYGHIGPIGADSAVWLYNLISDGFGCRVRPGTAEFATSLGDDVRSVFRYNKADGSFELFACTSVGVYDISAGGAGAWTPVLTWPAQNAQAGYCSTVNVTNVAGSHFLLVCDESNGYYIYDGTTWAVGTFTGSPAPSAANLVHVSEWSSRIWFVEKNSSRSWYLDPLALTGSITAFDVGSRFKKGGYLVQQTSWTIDDGAGMDDKFVQVSSTGDVLVWEGYDPSTPTAIKLSGRWSIGALPVGRRALSEWGGDVIILSVNGAVKLSTIVAGMVSTSDDYYLTRNISDYVRSRMSLSSNMRGWGMEYVTGENIAIISTPSINGDTIQFVVHQTQNAWSLFRGLSMQCMVDTPDGFFFGTADGRVMKFSGFVDNLNLAADQSDMLQFSLLSHYDSVDGAARSKRGHFLRPYWLGYGAPSYDAKILYDFNLNELTTRLSTDMSNISKWDSAVWGQSVWSSPTNAYSKTIGNTGMGRFMAVALHGRANNSVTYIGSNAYIESGGIL